MQFNRESGIQIGDLYNINVTHIVYTARDLYIVVLDIQNGNVRVYELLTGVASDITLPSTFLISSVVVKCD